MSKEEAIAWFVAARDQRLAPTTSIPKEVEFALARLSLSDWRSIGLSEQDAGEMMAALVNCDRRRFSRIIGAPFEFGK